MEYTLDQMQNLVRDANTRMEPMHLHWRGLERILATGMNRQVTTADLRGVFGGTDIEVGAVCRTVNVALPHITLIENTILQNDPQWIVYGRGAGDSYPITSAEEGVDLENRAQVAKAVLAHYWDKAEATEDAGDAMRDCVRIGNGFTKTAWLLTRAEVERDDADLQAEMIEVLTEEAQLDALTGTEGADPDSVLAEISTTSEQSIENAPFVAYVSPYNIRVPVNARKMKEVDWVAEIITVRIDQVRENPSYEKYFKQGNDVTVDRTSRDPNVALTQDLESDSVFEYVEVVEFWDMLNRRVVHFQIDGPEPLMDIEIPWSHPFPPYTHYFDYKVNPSAFFGYGELENIAGPQVLLGEVVRAEIDDLQKTGNKYFINKSYLTAEVREGLKSSSSDIAIPVNKPNNTPWEDILFNVPRPAADPQVWNMEQTLEARIRTILGINDFQAGLSGADRMTATAAASVDGNGAVRMQEKLRTYERGNAHTGKMIIMLAQEFLDEATAIRVGGLNAGTWLQIEPGDLEGEFGVRVDTGSTGFTNPATLAQRGQELINLLPTIQQFAQDPALRPALASALRLMGQNPDAILPPVQQAPAPVPGAPVDPAAGIPAQAQPAPTVDPASGHPADAMMALGGAPLPAATSGGIAL